MQHDQEQKLNDPQWVRFPGEFDHVIAYERENPSSIGIGGYLCNCCDAGNVVIALFGGQFQIEVGLTVEVAQNVAAELMLAIQRAGGVKVSS